MSSYLFVAFLGSGTFFVIQAFQNGVLAELFLDVQNGRLYLALLGKPFLFFPLFALCATSGLFFCPGGRQGATGQGWTGKYARQRRGRFSRNTSGGLPALEGL